IRDFHVTGVQTCALPILEIPGVRRNPLAEQTLELMAEVGQLSDLIEVTIAYVGEDDHLFDQWQVSQDRLPAIALTGEDGRDRGRSEERRVGKEGRALGGR